ncbi:MAG: hypothetical protein KME64_19240 [Scytonematopsis contorta HA4267-MV1]|jgi:hypothetical protein|nr:hypothetical protein [Scytonematopsis contorta HA4267-MV1]
MPPRIINSVAWEQAELLMQPAFIRVVDNIRKQLDASAWTGTYKDVLIWPTSTSDETKAMVMRLTQELEAATPEQAAQIRETLAQLPTPHPGYHLCLQRQEQQIHVDLWELCYQVCFLDYTPEVDNAVDIDTSLIDETGDVDWQKLDNKVRGLVDEVFAKLPE